LIANVRFSTGLPLTGRPPDGGKSAWTKNAVSSGFNDAAGIVVKKGARKASPVSRECRRDQCGCQQQTDPPSAGWLSDSESQKAAAPVRAAAEIEREVGGRFRTSALRRPGWPPGHIRKKSSDWSPFRY